jgi:protein-tyrosine phosphatase
VEKKCKRGKEIFMKIYDLHNHLLPSIDDGPDDMNESLEIVRISAEQKVEIILATPHRKDVNELYSIGHIKKLVDEINELSSDKGYITKIKLGMENHLDVHLPNDIQNGYALPMDEGKHILVEMPWGDRESYIDNTLNEIQEMNYIPVIAHPERMKIFMDDYGFLRELVSRGFLMQLTASSLYGKFGREVKMFAREILLDGLCRVIASDTHMAIGQREPDLLKGFEYAADIIGTQAAEKLVSDNPKELLEI